MSQYYYKTRKRASRYGIWWESHSNWVVVDWNKQDPKSVCGYFVVRRFRNSQDARSYLLQMGDDHA